MQEQLQRLTRLAGADPGFYVLALHSFVEYYVREVIRASDAENFADVVWDFRNALIAEADGNFVDGISCLTTLARQHRFTNAVRHSFLDLDPEEAVAATHLFLAFCALVEIDSLPAARTLGRSVDVWNDRESLCERSGVLRSLREEIAGLQARNTDLLAEIDAYRESRAQLADLESRMGRTTRELERARERARVKDARVDELRRERARLRDERRVLLKRMERHRELERYIEGLGRLSVYARTRMDFERSLMRLTPEQEEAAALVDGSSEFLIRGGAGTGKSLVLIDALRRSLDVGELQFESDGPKPALLLTFTRTLVKYEYYVTALLKLGHDRALVQTVDTFILDRLQRVDPAYRFDFDLLDSLVDELNTTGFFSNEELSAELEVFLFGNVVSRAEYVEEVVARAGMRRRLLRSQRERVWEIREQVARVMDERKTFSRNYARIVMLRHLEGADEALAARLRDVRTIYLDEAQDLTAGDLLTARSLITGHLVMAADSGQSIYGVSSPFMRAGIRISGRTRVLRTNFRNTRQILEFAQAFGDRDDAQTLFAFRDGPPPEVYTACEAGRLLETLLEKLEFFIDQLQYEPENICLLAPHRAELARLSDALSGRGIANAVITEPDFEFTSAAEVRISTLHSSKGLDFPVVLVYLPYLNRRQRFDEEATDRLLRNLIYVGITRAMENLNLFVCPGDDPLLNELCRAAALTDRSADR